jgi:predicted nucleotidyltransferase
MSRKKDIMTPFFEAPERELSIRETGRLFCLSPMTARKLLNAAVKTGILASRRERNLVLYKARTSSQTYKDAAIAHIVASIRSSGLVEQLVETLREPLAIFLFGSFAKADNRKGSDMDIFVLSRIKKEIDIKMFEKKLGTPIQLLICTPDDVDVLRKKNPHLLNNVINGVRLYGFWEAF